MQLYQSGQPRSAGAAATVPPAQPPYAVRDGAGDGDEKMDEGVAAAVSVGRFPPPVGSVALVRLDRHRHSLSDDRLYGVTSAPTVDPVLAASVDMARSAAEQEAAGLVGDHLDATADDELVATHYFATLDPAYRGWRWAVTLTRAPDGDGDGATAVGVDEVVLLPGEDALLAPPWVPWIERLRPGDLGVGDLLPTTADDPRLAATFLSTDDDEVAAASYELGLGRQRTLSFEGRVEAAERWYDGEPGPEAPIARAAPAACATCGFFVPLTGALRQAFGACANEYAPDDGRVVAVDHGCGAHSEAIVLPSSPPPPPPLLDEYGIDVVGGPLGHEPGSVSDADTTEPLGHS